MSTLTSHDLKVIELLRIIIVKIEKHGGYRMHTIKDLHKQTQEEILEWIEANNPDFFFSECPVTLFLLARMLRWLSIRFAAEDARKAELETCRNFTKFPNLPSELRLKIWKLALPGGRVIRGIAYSRGSRDKSNYGPLSNIRAACKESYGVVMKIYQKIPLERRACWGWTIGRECHKEDMILLFDPKQDLLVLEWQAHQRSVLRHLTKGHLPHFYENFNMLTSIAIEISSFAMWLFGVKSLPKQRWLFLQRLNRLEKIILWVQEYHDRPPGNFAPPWEGPMQRFTCDRIAAMVVSANIRKVKYLWNDLISGHLDDMKWKRNVSLVFPVRDKAPLEESKRNLLLSTRIGRFLQQNTIPNEPDMCPPGPET